MNNLLTLAVSILVFGTVVLVHEFGHYLVARRSGIRVLEFSIGMGPALFQKTKNGIAYSIRLFPVGGYVSMEAEDGEEDAEDEPDDGSPADSQAALPPAVEKMAAQNVAAKAAAGAAAGTAKGQNCPAAPTAADPRGAEPLPGQEVFPIVESAGIPFPEAPWPKRLAVMAAGACMNFILGFALLLALVNAQKCIVSRQIAKLEDGALSAETGLQVDDVILAVNGRQCFVANDIVYELSRTPDYSADFTVRRAGQKIELHNVRFDTLQNEDGSTKMQLGFTVYGVKKTPARVAAEAGRYTLYYGRLIFSSLLDLVSGRTAINDLSGPVGIVSAIGQAVSYGWQDVFSLAALITVNLGIFNLLPIPGLDGGKMLLVLVEAVIRRPLPTKFQIAINAAGMAFLFSIMLFATWQDILRLLA